MVGLTASKAFTICAIIAMMVLVHYATGEDLKLGVFDWSGVDGSPDVWLGNYTKSVLVNFFIAQKLFNDRRVDIFPDLARIATCDKNISIVKYCDVGGNPARAAYDALWMINDLNVDGLVGFAGLEASLAGSAVASAYDVPVVDHWVTAPSTTNRRYFPMYARTIPSDTSASEVLAVLVEQLKFRTVSMLYLNDGKDFASYTGDLMKSKNIELVSVEFTYGATNNNIRESVKKVAEQGRNVIICATWLKQLTEIADAAKEFGLLDDQHLWIFTYFNNPIGEEFHTLNPNITDLMHGSLFVTPLTDLNPNWIKYLEEYPKFESEVDWINELVPPFGSADEYEHCKDSMVDFQVFPGFFEATKTYGIVIWAYIVDIILSYGFAICDNNLDGPMPRGKELFNRLINIKFEGLSGTSMAYINTTGDRDWATAGYALLNFDLKPEYLGKTNGFRVGVFNKVTNKFEIEDDKVVFRSGVGMSHVPQDVTPPFHEQNFLPLWSKIIGIIELAIVQLFCVYCFVWLYKYRKERIVVNAQPALLVFILLGCMLGGWTILTLMVDDNPEGFGDPQVTCMASPVLFCTGLGLAIAALTGKTLRVYRIFNNRKLRSVRVYVHHVLTFVFLFIATYLALMIAWIIISPVVWERTVLFRDALGNPALSTGTCAADSVSGAFAISIFILFLGALLGAAYASHLVKGVSTEFQESRFVFIALISIAQVYFVAVPATFAVYSSTVGRFMILSSTVFLSVLCVVLCIFFPKIYYLQTGQELWATSNSTLTPHSPGQASHRVNMVTNSPVVIAPKTEATVKSVA